MNRKIQIYLMTLSIFAICIVIILAFNTSIKHYYQQSISAYEDSTWDTFRSNLRLASKFSTNDLEEKSKRIQDQMFDELDMDTLKLSLTHDHYYKAFDDILRNNLQKSVLQKQFGMSSNRNGIFVLCDGNLIADYSHLATGGYSELLGSPSDSNEKYDPTKNDIENIINKNAVNPELCMNAIRSIERQSYNNPIIWQYNKSASVDKNSLLTNVTMDDLEKIFREKGIRGLRSYEILRPVYITEYGNIFGDYDAHTPEDKTNKIILVQRINIEDFFSSYYIDSVTNPESESLKNDFSNTMILLMFFEILLYIAIGTYLIFVIFGINGMIEEYNHLYDEGKIDDDGNELTKNDPNDP